MEAARRIGAAIDLFEEEAPPPALKRAKRSSAAQYEAFAAPLLGAFLAPSRALSPLSRAGAVDVKPCRCDSRAHQRTSHSSCPLNKKNGERGPAEDDYDGYYGANSEDEDDYDSARADYEEYDDGVDDDDGCGSFFASRHSMYPCDEEDPQIVWFAREGNVAGVRALVER